MPIKGRVLKSTGSQYLVLPEGGETEVECIIRGKFRLDELKTTNPIAVGDYVLYDPETYVIDEILKRDNYIIRQSPRRKWQRQIIAANMDQAILIVTFSNPRTSLGFIDRFLVIAEMYHIPTVLVFNKADIYSNKDSEKYAEAREVYEALGYQCLLTSAITGEGVDALTALMNGKTSLVAGHSGVGKSTLINHIHPNLDLKTNTISKFSGKGKHTTTFANMYRLPDETYVIDTPGIKELGVVHLEPEEVGHYFREMKERVGQCRFDNCLHRTEPKCAVMEAVKEAEIAFFRYENYLHILENIESVNRWERK